MSYVFSGLLEKETDVMNNSDMQSPNIPPAWDACGHFVEYTTDAWQRSILYADAMRRRGNTYIEHLKNGQPPVLVFKYEMILDGREFKKHVNYSLVRITDRRAKKRTEEEKKRIALRSCGERRRNYPSARLSSSIPGPVMDRGSAVPKGTRKSEWPSNVATRCILSSPTPNRCPARP